MKNITKIIISGIVVAVFLYFFVSLQVKKEIASEMTTPDFMMELNDVRLRGWDKEKTAWELIATQAYYYDKNNVVLLAIRDGSFLDNKGDNLMKSISVATVNANIFKKEIILNEVSLDLKSERQERVVLRADSLRYLAGVFSSETSFSLMVGGWQISSGKLDFDTNENVIFLSNKVIITKDKNLLHSDTGVYSSVSNLLKLKDKVSVEYLVSEKGKEYKLFVSAGEADILLGEKESEVVFGKGLVFRLGEDVLQARDGKYNQITKLMHINEAIIRVNDGTQILNNIDKEDITGSSIRANNLDINFQQKIVNLVGGVVYERKARKVLATKGTYDVEKGLLFMHENVQILDGNKTIKANAVDVDVKNDVIVAKGNVKTKLKI